METWTLAREVNPVGLDLKAYPVPDPVLPQPHQTLRAIARRLGLRHAPNTHSDSRLILESMGFVVEEWISELTFKVTPPAGWTKQEDGYWTQVFDNEGRRRLSEFRKVAHWDTRVHLNVL